MKLHGTVTHICELARVWLILPCGFLFCQKQIFLIDFAYYRSPRPSRHGWIVTEIPRTGGEKKRDKITSSAVYAITGNSKLIMENKQATPTEKGLSTGLIVNLPPPEEKQL